MDRESRLGTSRSEHQQRGHEDFGGDYRNNRDYSNSGRQEKRYDTAPEDRANKVIPDAEHSKARMYDLPGESPMDFNLLDSDCRLREFKIDLHNEYVHSSMVDES